MKILVTGGAGFIGSHLVDRLVADKAGEIIVYDNLFRGRMENIAAHLESGRISFLKEDIRGYDKLLTVSKGVDVIYHLGAQSNVIGAVTNVDYSFESNVVGTYNVLKAANENKIGRVVFSSSREVYGEARYFPVDEDHPIGSKNTYGASKVSGEMYCQVFGNVFGVQVAILRFSNVYGPRDYGRVIPLWLDAARAGQNLTVFGGEQLIDFVWVDQVVEALIRASTSDIIGQPVNIGSGQGTAILDLAQRIISLVKTGSKLDMQPARSMEVVKFTADVTRMKTLLGLEPPADPLFGLEKMLG
jgi:nucleoside-diphosphate-sugar epimerase